MIRISHLNEVIINNYQTISILLIKLVYNVHIYDIIWICDTKCHREYIYYKYHNGCKRARSVRIYPINLSADNWCMTSKFLLKFCKLWYLKNRDSKSAIISLHSLWILKWFLVEKKSMRKVGHNYRSFEVWTKKGTCK